MLQSLSYLSNFSAFSCPILFRSQVLSHAVSLCRLPLLSSIIKKIHFYERQTKLSDAKRETPLFSFVLHLSEPTDLCFSFSFYEYLTLAPCVALRPGSLPLALRSIGAVQDTASSQKYFPKHWSHNAISSASQAKGQAPDFIQTEALVKTMLRSHDSRLFDKLKFHYDKRGNIRAIPRC